MKNKLKILLSFVFLNLSTYCQTWQWVNSSNGAYGAVAGPECIDNNGNIIVVTTAYSISLAGGSSTLNAQSQDIFLIKYDPLGNIIWMRNYGGSTHELSYDITCDSLNNLFLTGLSMSPVCVFGNDTIINKGSWDTFLMKLDPNGNIVWARGLNGNKDEYIMGTTVDRLGNCYVGGSSISDTLIIGKDTIYNNSIILGFLVKYDTNGNKIWNKILSGDSTFGGWIGKIKTDDENNLISTGGITGKCFMLNSDTISQSSNSFGGSLLMKLDGNGKLIWYKTYSNNAFYDIEIYNNSSYITGDNDSTTIMKHDKNGNLEWSKGVQFSTGLSVSTNACGVFLVGSLQPSITTTIDTFNLTTPNLDCHPIFLTNIDHNGKTVYVSTLLDGGFYDLKIESDKNCNAYLFGTLTGFIKPFVIGTTSITIISSRQIFTAKLNFVCEPPPVNTINDTTICFNNKTLIGNNIRDGAIYNWSPNYGLNCTNCPNPVANPTISTKYYVTKTLCNYTTYDSVQINVFTPKNKANLGNEKVICKGEKVTLSDSIKTTFSTYSWSPNTYLSCTNCYSTISNPDENILYELVKTECNISSRDSIKVKVIDCEEEFYFPNIFTPNNDNVNDIWSIKFPKNYQLENLSIYNRWGNLIYEIKDLNFKLQAQALIGWDGRTTSGIECGDGVYFFVITYKDRIGGKKNANGFISLIR